MTTIEYDLDLTGGLMDVSIMDFSVPLSDVFAFSHWLRYRQDGTVASPLRYRQVLTVTVPSRFDGTVAGEATVPSTQSRSRYR